MNVLLIIASGAVNFTKGWIVTVVGFLIVIMALFILSTIFRGVAAYFKSKDAKKEDKAKAETTQAIENTAKPVLTDGEMSPEVLTAIGMALYLATNLHDEESNVITIEHRNTAWNAKSYGVRHWNH